MRDFSHILVPVDFSQANHAALARAMEIAGPTKTRITLLHVIEEVPYAEDDQIDTFYAMLQRQAEQKMSELAAASQRGDGPEQELEMEIIVGRRGPEILRFTAENEVDLVVMSSHAIHPDDLSRGWATLSYQVSIICPCSVLLVK